MAKTFPKRAMGVTKEHHPMLSYAARWEPEGASQTFTMGTPVVFSSGLLVACTDPIETDANNYVSGLAIEDAHNLASGARCKFIPAIEGVMFYANFMTGDGATNALAAADLNDIAGCAASSKSGFVRTGITDWFLDDADANGATVVSFVSDITVPNVDNGNLCEVGDNDARVGFVFLRGATLYGYAAGA